MRPVTCEPKHLHSISPTTGTGASERAGALSGPAIAERYPLEQAGTAYARVESGEVAGRVLLLMG
jgi:hypothetical protein